MGAEAILGNTKTLSQMINLLTLLQKTMGTPVPPLLYLAKAERDTSNHCAWLHGPRLLRDVCHPRIRDRTWACTEALAQYREKPAAREILQRSMYRSLKENGERLDVRQGSVR